jgi:hypothetical protein
MAVGLDENNPLLAKAFRVVGGPEIAMLLGEVALTYGRLALEIPFFNVREDEQRVRARLNTYIRGSEFGNHF